MADWCFDDLHASYDLRDEAPPWTRAVDADQNDLKALLCGRRSGKTSYIALKLAMDGIPGEVHPFVCLTQQKARDNLWPILERFQKTHGLKVEYNRSTGTATTDRGVIIQCMGLSTKPEIEKLRGQRYPGVIFDECGAMNPDLLKTAIFEAAEPATADFFGRGGFGVICSGTPSYAPTGLWYDICGGNEGESKHGFSVFRATILDNHHMPNAEAYLARKRQQKKWDENTPEYMREYRGHFCLSTDGLCYGRAWNGVVEHRVLMPLQGLTIIALDFGESSPCAWTVIRVTRHIERIGDMIHESMIAHVLEARRQVCGSLNEIAGITRQLMKAYSASYLVGDSAEGFGIRQLIQQYGLPFERSEKSGLKQERIFMMQGMLRCGQVRVYEDCPDLIEEIQTVPWNEDHDDHHCLVPGTLISLSNGPTPIEQVRAGDIAMTRKGQRRVLKSWLAKREARVINLTATTGETITGTANHPVMTCRGWVRMDGLVVGDTLCNLRENTHTWTECEFGAAASRVASLSDTGAVSDVYDLEIDGEPEFYANGLLVHNSSYADHCCDSLHYAIEKAMMLLKIRPAAPAPGTAAYAEQKQTELKAKLIAAAKKAQGGRR